MGRYSSYGIATRYGIPLEDLEKTIKRRANGKTLEDFHIEDLRAFYPQAIYDIEQTDSAIYISLKETFNGSDIYSLLKDFSTIAPNKNQLTPEIADEVGALIKDKPLEEVLELAKRGNHECFQTFKLPPYLYHTPVPIGDKRVYAQTMVKGILINYSYSKIDTEDDSEPYDLLTDLLRYRLKDNTLSPTMLAFLSV